MMRVAEIVWKTNWWKKSVSNIIFSRLAAASFFLSLWIFLYFFFHFFWQALFSPPFGILFFLFLLYVCMMDNDVSMEGMKIDFSPLYINFLSFLTHSFIHSFILSIALILSFFILLIFFLLFALVNVKTIWRTNLSRYTIRKDQSEM
jgi:hypothetical protein